MPEDLRDMLADFDLMLEGYVKLAKEGSVCEDYDRRLISYWDNLSAQVDKVLRDKKEKR